MKEIPLINKKLIFLFFSFLIYIKSNFIIIPLKKYTYNYSSEYDDISKIYSNIFYTELSIGEPFQKIITFINTTKDSNFGIYNKYCDSLFYLNNPRINKNYIFENSTTFYQIGEGDMKLGTKDILINDQMTFYTNFELTEEKKIENISLLYNPNNFQYILDDVGIDFIIEKEKRTACGYIGLRLEMLNENSTNLVKQLKEKKIISKAIFNFFEINKKNNIYKNENIDYLLVIGEEIYDILKIKDINKYISDKYINEKYTEQCKINDYILNEFYFRWKITINNIYIKIDNNNFDMEQINNIYLDNDFGIIVGTYEYRKMIKEKFFKEYIDKDKCSEKTFGSYDSGYFYYIICDSDINVNNFPEIYFKSKNLQYIFKLTKDNLFIKDNKNYYFLIVFEYSRTNTWVLGKPFLEKYLFSYDYDAKTISFYNDNLLENEKEKQNNKVKYIILIVSLIILLIIALIIGFLFGKNIYYQRKKRKALELDSPLDNDYINEETTKNDKKEESIN